MHIINEHKRSKADLERIAMNMLSNVYAITPLINYRRVSPRILLYCR